MIIFSLTEASARFITGMIAFLIVAAFFGWLSQLTGIHPFILVLIVISSFILFFIYIGKSIKEEKSKPVSIISFEEALSAVRQNNNEIERSTLKKLENLAASKHTGAAMFEIICDHLKSQYENNSYDNAWEIEKLYLSLRYRQNEERIKLLLKKLIFSFPLFTSNFTAGMNGKDGQITENVNHIVEQLFIALTTGLNDKELDNLLLKHFAPRLSQKPDRFPTNLSIINVAAIEKGSFLEKCLIGQLVDTA